MASTRNQEALEAQGFSYNENTFDDLFVKKFRDVLNVSTESSGDERDFGDIGDSMDVGEEQINSSAV